MHLFIHQIDGQHSTVYQPRVLSRGSKCQDQNPYSKKQELQNDTVNPNDQEPIIDLLPISGTHSILILTHRNARFQSNALNTPKSVTSFNILDINSDYAIVSINDIQIHLNRIVARNEIHSSAKESMKEIMKEVNKNYFNRKDGTNKKNHSDSNNNLESDSYQSSLYIYKSHPIEKSVQFRNRPSSASQAKSKQTNSNDFIQFTPHNDRRRPMSATSRIQNEKSNQLVRPSSARPSSARPKSALSRNSSELQNNKALNKKLRGSFAQKTMKAAEKVYGNNTMLQKIIFTKQERAILQNSNSRKRPNRPTSKAQTSYYSSNMVNKISTVSTKNAPYKTRLSASVTDEYFEMLEKELEREFMLRNIKSGANSSLDNNSNIKEVQSHSVKFAYRKEERKPIIDPVQNQSFNSNNKLNKKIKQDESIYDSGSEINSPRPNQKNNLEYNKYKQNNLSNNKSRNSINSITSINENISNQESNRNVNINTSTNQSVEITNNYNENKKEYSTQSQQRNNNSNPYSEEDEYSVDSIEIKINQNNNINHHRYNQNNYDEIEEKYHLNSIISNHNSNETVDEDKENESIEDDTDLTISTMQIKTNISDISNNRYVNNDLEEEIDQFSTQNKKPNFDKNDLLQISDEDLSTNQDFIDQDDIFASDNESDPFEDELESEDDL